MVTKRINIIWIIILCLYCGADTGFAATWNVAEDFSISGGNPNGRWGYGRVAGSIASPYSLTLYNTGTIVNVDIVGGGTMPLEVWQTGSESVPAVQHNANSQQINAAFGGFWSAGATGFHPTTDYSVFRFTAPTSGNYYIWTKFSTGHPWSTSTDVHVIKNGSSSSRAELFSGIVNAINIGIPAPTQYTGGPISLSAGNTLDFMVGPYTDSWGADQTLVDVTIVNTEAEYLAFYFEQMQITLSSDVPAHLFYPSDTVRLDVSVDPPAIDVILKVTANLFDEEDNAIGNTGPVYLNSGNNYSNSLFPADQMGYYRIVVKVEQDSNPANYCEAETEYGVIPANNAMDHKEYDSPFGVICHWGTDTAHETIKRLGIGWVRQDAGDQHFQLGFFDVALAHNLCYMAVCKNYESLPTDLFAPTLASDPDFPRSGPGSWDYSAQVAFYRSMAENYGYGVDAYDIMNEPWGGWGAVLGGGWSGGPWLETFADYGRQVAQAIHSEDPTSLIIWPENDLRFYDDFYQYGLADFNNVIGDHPYNVDPRNPWPEDEDVIAFHQDSWFNFVNSNSLPWRYWSSEVGFSSFQNADPQAPRGRSNTLPQQAEMLVRMMVLQLFWGTEKIFWYDLYNDGPDPHEPEHNYGLVSNGPKPSSVAYAQLIYKIKGWERIARCNIGGGEQVHAYTWKQPASGNLTMIAWIRDGSMSRSIPVSSAISQVTVTDINGRNTIINVLNNEITVTLGPSPIYMDGLTEEDIASFIHGDNVVADAAKDFSITNGNPNGPWSYGQITTNINSQYALTKYNTGTTVNVTTADGDTMPLNVWRSGSAGEPGVHFNPNEEPIITGDPFGSFWPPHTFSFHPGGTGQYSTLRWTAPAAGIYDISALFRPGYIGGTSTYAYVVRNGSTASHQNLFTGEVDAKNDGPFQTVYSDELTLNAGETIDFAINYGYDYGFDCDLTLADIVITREGVYPLEQVTLTTEVNEESVNSIVPSPGTHDYYKGWQVKLDADTFISCGVNFAFTHWTGSDIQTLYMDSTSVNMDADKTVIAHYVDNCGPECDSFLASDLNEDCYVDVNDLVNFISNWLSCSYPDNPECTTP